MSGRVTFQLSADAVPETRNVRILNSDVKKHGPTTGCAGCRAAVANKNWRSAHTAECRTRMQALMMTDDDGRRRVELAAENMVNRIVGITGDVAEEEESKKRRLETATAAENSVPALPEEVLPSVRAARGGKDAVTPANAAAKRKAEEEPDDPRSGVYSEHRVRRRRTDRRGS